MKKHIPKNTPGAVSRRDFIKGIGTGALGTAVLPPFLGQSIETQKGQVPLYSQKDVVLTINGKALRLTVEANETLLDVLRERFDLTGTKKVCNRGECGGCTVLVDGAPVYACLFLAVRADGRKITTIEGLADGDKLHPVQEAYIEKDGYQCGYCTPGFIMASTAFLAKNENPTRDEVKHALSGNLCRCGNYAKIYKAVESAARKMRRP